MVGKLLKLVECAQALHEFRADAVLHRDSALAESGGRAARGVRPVYWFWSDGLLVICPDGAVHVWPFAAPDDRRGPVVADHRQIAHARN